MEASSTKLGTVIRLTSDFDAAVQRVIDALKVEGFGVLTEIDVKATLKEKLGEDFRPYKILGACNPPLAHRALSAVPEAGLLLPCNVTVSEIETGVVEVALINPLVMMQMLPSEELAQVAADAAVRLKRVAAALEN
jgi:uncharacterized protein (DUF302 family)